MEVLERAAHLLVRKDSALHPAWIEEDGIARPIVVPEVGVERQERIDDFHAAIVEQFQVVVAAAPVHRRGKVDVHPQLIGGHDVTAWIEMGDGG